ncbi:hypothetical protein [Dendronalium phyllosphericum]|uniref:hypothetical protein n=1 Tax=Dendronalium phyllosphericum TaxID=2840445 RepID=UPI001CED6DC0|nr:hypothetical protein [Dendronalium phyllosphericum]
MLVLKRKLFFSVGEVWFDEEPKKLNNVDVIYYKQWKYPIAGAQSQEVQTRLIDLTKSHNELWHRISSNDRYKIRRAEQKDEVNYEYWNHINSDLINKFADFYDLFAIQKGLVKIDRQWLKKRADAGLIDISHVKLKNGSPFVWHAYYVHKNRVFFYILHLSKMTRIHLISHF